MSETPSAPIPASADGSPLTAKPPEVFLHRVCIQCNNVFRVPADQFDAKQCPNCHKG